MKMPILLLALTLASLSSAFGGERRIRIELRIEAATTGATEGRRAFLSRKEDPKPKAGADIALIATAGKTFTASSFGEFIAPSAFSPPEILGDPAITYREDGSMLVVGAELPGNDKPVLFISQPTSSFPVTPVNPSAFEQYNVGWEIEGTPKISADGLVLLEAEIRHHDARPAVAHYGEGTGPIVTKARSAFGKEVEVILTENKAMRASTSITRTPLVLKARSGVTYPIKVMLGDKAVAATIRCVVEGAKSGGN